MHTQQKDLSYFALTLTELLNNSFPDKVRDKTFIHQRSELAATAYETAFRSGTPVAECERIANATLFEGLYFSPFDTVFTVVCNEFDTVMMDEELRPFALKMLPVCHPLFEKYQLTDDFAYTYEYDALYTEVTGTIAIWIEENGLQ